MQNTVTGCTMMINRKLVQLSLPIPNNCMMHDCWITIVARSILENDRSLEAEEKLLSIKEILDLIPGTK